MMAQVVDDTFAKKQRELQQLAPSELVFKLEARVVGEALAEKRSEAQRSGACERGLEVGGMVRHRSGDWLPHKIVEPPERCLQ